MSSSPHHPYGSGPGPQSPNQQAPHQQVQGSGMPQYYGYGHRPQAGYGVGPGGQAPPQIGPRAVGFKEAMRSWVRNMFVFSGRSSRSEFWWPYGVVVGTISLVATIYFFSLMAWIIALPEDSNAAAQTSMPAGLVLGYPVVMLLSIGIMVTFMGLAVRRLHDANFSGLFLLFSLAGLSIIPFVLWFMPSRPEGARYDEPGPGY